jgi:excisionase family DNA binding protein
MTAQPSPAFPKPGSRSAPSIVLLTAKEAAERLKVSLSWLAKARMRGDGPPFIKVGRSIRYSEAALLQWMKARQRLSTSEY